MPRDVNVWLSGVTSLGVAQNDTTSSDDSSHDVIEFVKKRTFPNLTPIVCSTQCFTLALLMYVFSSVSTSLSLLRPLLTEERRRPIPRAANHKAQPMLSSKTVFRGDTK